MIIDKLITWRIVAVGVIQLSIEILLLQHTRLMATLALLAAAQGAVAGENKNYYCCWDHCSRAPTTSLLRLFKRLLRIKNNHKFKMLNIRCKYLLISKVNQISFFTNRSTLKLFKRAKQRSKQRDIYFICKQYFSCKIKCIFLCLSAN